VQAAADELKNQKHESNETTPSPVGGAGDANQYHVASTPGPAAPAAVNKRLSSHAESLSTESTVHPVNKGKMRQHALSVDSSCSEVATPAGLDNDPSYWTSDDEDSFDEDDVERERFEQHEDSTLPSLTCVRTCFLYL
jgi:hypothetical protein